MEQEKTKLTMKHTTFMSAKREYYYSNTEIITHDDVFIRVYEKKKKNNVTNIDRCQRLHIHKSRVVNLMSNKTKKKVSYIVQYMQIIA